MNELLVENAYHKARNAFSMVVMEKRECELKKDRQIERLLSEQAEDRRLIIALFEEWEKSFNLQKEYCELLKKKTEASIKIRHEEKRKMMGEIQRLKKELALTAAAALPFASTNQ